MRFPTLISKQWTLHILFYLKIPFLEIINSPAQNIPGLHSFPIFPPTPNLSPLATLLPYDTMRILLLRNLSLPSDVIYFHIFTIKLGCLRKRVLFTCPLYLQCQVQGLAPRRFLVSIEWVEEEINEGRKWYMWPDSAVALVPHSWTSLHHCPKHLESWVYPCSPAALAHHPH